MSQMKEWLTVIEAAFLVGRKKSSVYEWVKSGKLPSRVGVDGVTEVATQDVMRVEATVKRGRPVVTASRNGENK